MWRWIDVVSSFAAIMGKAAARIPVRIHVRFVWTRISISPG